MDAFWFILHVDTYNHRWWLHTEEDENLYPKSVIFRYIAFKTKNRDNGDQVCPVCDGAGMYLEGTYRSSHVMGDGETVILSGEKYQHEYHR